MASIEERLKRMRDDEASSKTVAASQSASGTEEASITQRMERMRNSTQPAPGAVLSSAAQEESAAERRARITAQKTSAPTQKTSTPVLLPVANETKKTLMSGTANRVSAALKQSMEKIQQASGVLLPVANQISGQDVRDARVRRQYAQAHDSEYTQLNRAIRTGQIQTAAAASGNQEKLAWQSQKLQKAIQTGQDYYSQEGYQRRIDALKKDLNRLQLDRSNAGTIPGRSTAFDWSGNAAKIKETKAALERERNEQYAMKQAETLRKYSGTGSAEEAAKGLASSPKTHEQYAALGGLAQDAFLTLKGDRSALGNESVTVMTDEERQTFLSLLGREDYAGAAAWYAAVKPQLDARYQAQKNAETTAFAKEHPVLGAAYHTLQNLTAGEAYIANVGQALKNAVTGEYEPTNPNSRLFVGANASSASAKGIREAAEETGGPVLGFLSETGLSMLDMAARMPTGAMSLPLIGLSAAGSNTLDTLERGGTPEQALITSTAAGAAEILTEKLPMDELFRLAHTSPRTAKELMRNTLKSMGSEATQEIISEYANNIVDQVVMQDKSEYENYVRDLVDQGVEESEARRQATLQFYLANPALAGLGGALSGGGMSLAAQGIGYASNRKADNIAADNIAEEQTRNLPEVLPVAAEAEQQALQTETASTRETALVPMTEQAEKGRGQETISNAGIAAPEDNVQDALSLNPLDVTIPQSDTSVNPQLLPVAERTAEPLPVRETKPDILPVKGEEQLTAVAASEGTELLEDTGTQGTDAQEEPALPSEEPKRNRGKATKPAVESKPIIAKKEFRQQVNALFSVPDGRKTEVGAYVSDFADRLLKQGEISEADRQEFFDRMYEEGIAEIPADEYYQDVRARLKGSRIYVDEITRDDMTDDEWADFRHRAFAAGIFLTRRNSDRGIDSWNMELAEAYPGTFDAQELAGRQILETMISAAESGKSERVSLADSIAAEAAEGYITEDEILDNMERQLDYQIRAFGEKANLEVKLRDRSEMKLTKALEKERQHRAEVIEKARKRKELRELQSKTLKSLQWLNKNKYRAPEDLKASYEAVLGDIDLYAIGMADEMHWDKKRGATWGDLAELYQAAKENDPNFFPSEDLERIVSRVKKDKIADMDVEALKNLYKAAIRLQTEYYNRNTVLKDEKRRKFSELYSEATGELKAVRGGYTGKDSDTFFNLRSLTPMNVIRRMSGWKTSGALVSMAEQLEQGERDIRDYQVRARRHLETFLEEHKDWVKRADGQGKDAVWYEVELPELVELGMGSKPIFGDTITVYMTPAQKVHLYLESGNMDNLRHMAGGRTFVNKELYAQGKRQEAFAQGTTVRLAPETVKKIVSDMTEEEMALARALEPYYNQFSKQKINAVSNLLYGYDKAMSSYYVPIYTNNNYVQSEIGKFDQTAEGVPNMKNRLPFARNPTYNISALEAFEKHVDRTARFVGMAVPARNWQTLLNWRTDKSSMGDELTHKWGKEGKEYLVNLLQDLQRGESGEKTQTERAADTVLSHYISSVFGFNPGIVFKQAMSLPLAGTYLGWRNVPNVAAALRTSDTLINTYTSELAYRLQGYATPETATLQNNPSKLRENKALRFTFGGGAITAMDGATVKTIWRWAENFVSREQPDLERGSQQEIDAGTSPYYQAVAKAFEEAVSHSQPMYDVMHRAEILRSKSTVDRTITLFKTVPIQQYNMLRQTIGEAQQAKWEMKDAVINGHGKEAAARKQEYRQARGKAGRAVLGVLLAGLGIEAINFLNALVKNGGKRYRDEDGALTFSSAMGTFLRGFASDNAGMIAGGDTVCELIGSAVTGDRWHEIEIPGITQTVYVVQDILASGQELAKMAMEAYDVWHNGGDVTVYWQRHGADCIGVLDHVAEKAAAYLGEVPAGNIKAYCLGALRWISPEMEVAYQDALAVADKNGLTGLKDAALETRVGDLLKNRLGKSEDGTAGVLASLYGAGYKKAIPSDTPKQITVSDTSIQLSAYQQQIYDQIWRDQVAGTLDRMVQSEEFTRSGPEIQEQMIDKLYQYGAARAKMELSDAYEPGSWVTDGSKSEDLAEYLSWRVLAGDYYQRWSNLIDNGLDKWTALDVAETLGQLEPEPEHKNVSKLQQYRAAIEMVDEKEQMVVLQVLMDESEYARLEAGVQCGVSPEMYISAREAIARQGSMTQKLAKQAISEMSLRSAQKAALWQMMATKWEPKNNPFDTKVGKMVWQKVN